MVFVKEIESFKNKKLKELNYDNYYFQKDLISFCNSAQEVFEKAHLCYDLDVEKMFQNQRDTFEELACKLYLIKKSSKELGKRNNLFITKLFNKQKSTILFHSRNLSSEENSSKNKLIKHLEDFNLNGHPRHNFPQIKEFENNFLEKMSRDLTFKQDNIYSFCDYSNYVNSKIVNYFGLDDSSLFKKTRKPEITFPRHLAIYLISENNLRKIYSEKKVILIADLFNQDHSTISYACKRISGLVGFPSKEGKSIDEVLSIV